jgi:hypothetical protein
LISILVIRRKILRQAHDGVYDDSLSF